LDSATGDTRESWVGARRTNSGAKSTRILLAGLELRGGSGPRSPRLLLTRAWLTPLRRLDGVAIQLLR